MSEMIERMARRLFERLAGDPDWDDAYETKAQAEACGNDDISQEECFDIARDILDAMREPTEEMEFAAIPAEIEARCKENNIPIGESQASLYRPMRSAIRAAWKAMVDEAMKDQPTQYPIA